MYGIILDMDSSSNTFSNNTANSNKYEGVSLGCTVSNNMFSGDTANLNGGSGVNIYGANSIFSSVNASLNGKNGFSLISSAGNTFTGNGVASGNGYDGFNLTSSNSNTITGNYITNNTRYGISLDYNSGNNTIYNNYFYNDRNALVPGMSSSSESVFGTTLTNNTWSVTPTAGPNIVNGPYIGGNYWATPEGTGWSQTHPDIGMGFTEQYNLAGSTSSSIYQFVIPGGQNIDQHPLTLNGPVPTPTPTQSGSYSVVIPPSPVITSPYDAAFTGNTIPGTMEACHSYTVGLTVKNTGTMNWSFANGVVLVPSSSNGFTFDPSRYRIPEGVVVHPGDSYTFPVTINVPCPMNNGTYQLRFKMAYTVQTKSGPVEIPFGDSLAESVTVGTSSTTGVKSGMKAITQSSTISGSSTGSVSRQFTTVIPNTEVSSLTTAHGYLAGSRTNTVTTTAFRNFNAITGLLWYSLQLDE